MAYRVLLRSSSRATTQLFSSSEKVTNKVEEDLLGSPFLSRCYRTESNAEVSFKGHNMLGPFTLQSTELDPFVTEKSEGCYVYDTHGTKYLDGLAGLWSTSLELVEIFTARKMAKVFFVNSGSEANDTIVKLVWYYNNALGKPNKKKFISRSAAYISWFKSRISQFNWVSNFYYFFPTMHQQFDLPIPFVLHTDCPHYWRYHLPGHILFIPLRPPAAAILLINTITV
ncbi:hypothetical protein V2J09_009439 [Rumex salicifolius]